MSNLIILNKQYITQNETMWATVKQIAEIFGCTVQNAEYHVKRIFDTGELIQDSVTKKILVTASDGKNYDTIHYNLDMIIAIGYGVNSSKATQFRIEATKVLKEYLVKGKVQASNQIQLPNINADFMLQVANQMKQLEEANKQLTCAVEHLEEEKQVLDGQVSVLSAIHKVEHDLRGLQKCGKDLGLNPNKFIAQLKDLGFLTKTTPPMPYQKYIDCNLFVVKVVSYKRYQDDVLTEKETSQAYVTHKGYIHFQNMIAKNPNGWAKIASPELKVKLKEVGNKIIVNFRN